MTEEEAKTKACHRVQRDPHVLFDLQPGQRCIGSACMAWRVSDPHGGFVTGLDDRRFYASDVRPYEAITTWTVERQPPSGFCGLAGRP